MMWAATTTGSIGMRAVAAAAFDVDGDPVGGGHHGAGAHRDLPGRQAGPVVHGIDRIAGESLEQSVVDHGLRATEALFTGLEDQVGHAVELPRGREVACRAQQHGGVPVVAAGVHHAVALRAPGHRVFFLDGQRVHVGAQADAPPKGVAPAAHHRHQTGAPQATVHLIDPAAGQFARHQFGGDMLLEAQFGVAMQLVPDLDQVTMMLAQAQQRGMGAEIGFRGIHG
jgi:hypothetical protein